MSATMPIVFRTLFSVIVASSLVACGGGGGDGGSTSPVASTSTFQLKSAYVSYVTDTGAAPW